MLHLPRRRGHRHRLESLAHGLRGLLLGRHGGGAAALSRGAHRLGAAARHRTGPQGVPAAAQFARLRHHVHPQRTGVPRGVCRTAQRAIWSDAYDKKVIISSPTNLFALLKLVADLWKYNDQDKNTKEIAACGLKLYEQLVAFTASLEGVGTALDKARDAYEAPQTPLHGQRQHHPRRRTPAQNRPPANQAAACRAHARNRRRRCGFDDRSEAPAALPDSGA